VTRRRPGDACSGSPTVRTSSRWTLLTGAARRPPAWGARGRRICTPWTSAFAAPTRTWLGSTLGGPGRRACGCALPCLAASSRRWRSSSSFARPWRTKTARGRTRSTSRRSAYLWCPSRALAYPPWLTRGGGTTSLRRSFASTGREPSPSPATSATSCGRTASRPCQRPFRRGAARPSPAWTPRTSGHLRRRCGRAPPTSQRRTRNYASARRATARTSPPCGIRCRRAHGTSAFPTRSMTPANVLMTCRRP